MNGTIPQDIYEENERLLKNTLLNKNNELKYLKKQLDEKDNIQYRSIFWNNAKKIYDELKMSGDYDDQSSKVEYISKKISKCEGFLYEEQGDKKYKNKEMKEAVTQYELSKESFSKSNVGREILERVEKKLKVAIKKANKKWWEIWKFKKGG